MFNVERKGCINLSPRQIIIPLYTLYLFKCGNVISTRGCLGGGAGGRRGFLGGKGG